MRKQYHYLVAGLPDLFFEDNKLSFSIEEFREVLSENLTAEDFDIIKLFYFRYDNGNILSRMKDAESKIDTRAILTSEQLDALYELAKEGAAGSLKGIPEYMGKLVEAFRAEIPVIEGKSWELQLSELYYTHATSHENAFVAKWFRFERDLQNILTASQCRLHHIPVENQLAGSGELIEKLSRSNARDFGIDNDFPMLEQILKAVEEDDLKEFEKKVDRIKWNYLDEEVFFHYFTIEKVFSFVVKLSIVERWMHLDKDTGQELFKELLQNMEATYEFPEEFKLK